MQRRQIDSPIYSTQSYDSVRGPSVMDRANAKGNRGVNSVTKYQNGCQQLGFRWSGYQLVSVSMCAQPCLALCDSMDYSPPGFSGHGIFQAGILEWVAISSSRGSSQPGIKPMSPASPASASDSFTN